MPSSVLATVRGVELVHAGRWQISTGTWEPTPDDLTEAVAALDCPAVRRPVLKLGHTDPRFDGEPAIGFIANLATSSDGQALVGDYVGIPAWLAETDDEGRSVLSSAYPDRSVEGTYDFTCQLGHTHPFVLTAVALLGVMPPGVGTLASLNDVAALYGIPADVAADAGRAPRSTGRQIAARTTNGGLMPAPDLTASQRRPSVAAAVSVQDVRRAFYEGPAEHEWSWWITDVFIDPNYLLVMDDDNDVVYRVDFTVNGEDITFADPKPGTLVWTPAADKVAAAAAPGPRPAASFADRATSRPGQQPAASSSTSSTQTPPAEPAAGPTKNQEDDIMSDTLSEGLRQRLGIQDAELDEQGLLSALDEALTERADTSTSTTPQSAPTLPEGTVAVDAATLEELRVAAAAGREAREQQLADRRTALVDAAIGDGRIAPARREHWLASLKADPGNEQVLASLQPGLIPVAAKGHDGGEGSVSDPAAADDYWFPGITAGPTAQEG